MDEVILIVEKDPEVHYMREVYGGSASVQGARPLNLNDTF